MFGLMKAKTCSATPEVKLRRRLHYCGTCKTIGRLYGQRARFLLNNDTVFLAELLSALSGDDLNLPGWAGPYRSFNCMATPKAVETIPASLQVAAAATMVMTEFKVADRIADRQGHGWRLARLAFRDSFGRATDALKAWEFPIDELRDCWDAQIKRERMGTLPAGITWDDSLRYYADSTGRATGLFFEHGSRIAAAGLARDEMRALGQSFGELIYLLDALEDYEKDARSGDFNPLRLVFPNAGPRLESRDRERAIEMVRGISVEVEAGLADLPIPRERAVMFVSRLRGNLANSIGIKLPVVPAEGRICKHHDVASVSMTRRLSEAVTSGRQFARVHLEECESLGSRVLAPFVFAYTAAMALVFPDQMRGLVSVREALGMPFNLMLLGGLVRSGPAIHLKPIPPSGPPPGGGVGPPPMLDPEEASKHAELAAESTKKGGGCCGSDCCCDCGDCDCCCDCGDCCNCDC